MQFKSSVKTPGQSVFSCCVTVWLVFSLFVLDLFVLSVPRGWRAQIKSTVCGPSIYSQPPYSDLDKCECGQRGFDRTPLCPTTCLVPSSLQPEDQHSAVAVSKLSIQQCCEVSQSLHHLSPHDTNTI